MAHAIGYLVGSHVVYNHKALPLLLESMIDINKIDPACIVVIVNGAWRETSFSDGGIHFYFRQQEARSHFAPLVDFELGSRLNIEYWFYINCTSRCGPRFKRLVESGYDPDADATAAGCLLPLGPSGGTDGRAINDLAMYRYRYLMRDVNKIGFMDDMTSVHAIRNWEGMLYAHAPKQAHYPVLECEITGPTDIYGTGTPRITEYYPGIDWYRFKKNWGQLQPGCYIPAAL